MPTQGASQGGGQGPREFSLSTSLAQLPALNSGNPRQGGPRLDREATRIPAVVAGLWRTSGGSLPAAPRGESVADGGYPLRSDPGTTGCRAP
jgi:hypothetical protein